MTHAERRDGEHWEAVEEASELLLEGRHHEALVTLRNVIKADPNNPYAYHYLGATFYELAQHEAARDAYRAAVRLAPDFLGARVALSHVYRALGDGKAALSEANEALRRFPSDGEAMHAAGLANALLGHRKVARRQLEGYLASGTELESQLEVKQILEMLGLGEEGEPVEFE